MFSSWQQISFEKIFTDTVVKKRLISVEYFKNYPSAKADVIIFFFELDMEVRGHELWILPADIFTTEFIRLFLKS